MSRRLGLALMLSLCAFVVAAAGPGAVRKQVEASTVVTGTIEIEPDGSVSAHRLDQPEVLPEGISALAAQVVPGWRFEPIMVDGRPAPVRAKMSLRVVAKKQGNDGFLLSIRSAAFGADAGAPGETVTSKQMRLPRFPVDAVRSGVAGTVFLVLRIGQQGQVEDVVAERVNLRVIGSEQQMKRGRDLLADASVVAARKWTFAVPDAGPDAGRAFWNVRVPVDYTFDRPRKPAYGEWEAYVPGPYQRAPWVASDAEGSQHGSDALIAGGVYPLGSGPRLLTPLGEDAG